jgi:hypothetical protein
MRLRPLTVTALTALIALALAGAAWRDRARARHIAIPVLADPSAPEPSPEPLRDGPPCVLREVARVAGRVTALLVASDGALYVGTFDEGVVRLAPPGDAEDGSAVAPAFAGRERFVNALAEHEGLVWAATQGGVVALDGERRVVSLLPAEAVTALSSAGTALYAGTPRGVFRISVEDGAVPVEATGPSGEPLRVTALAASGGQLWIGTSSGAYSLPLASARAPLLARVARWHPLVFGEPPASTNVVTALAPLAGGVLAGTDDGGAVRIREDGSVSAARLAEPRANEVNPGAAAALEAAPGGGAGVLLGTQGGGLLLARASGEALSIARLARGEISAVHVLRQAQDERGAGDERDAGSSFLVGAADGAVLSGSCPAPQGRRQVTQTDPFVAQLDCGYFSLSARPVAGSACLSPPL